MKEADLLIVDRDVAAGEQHGDEILFAAEAADDHVAQGPGSRSQADVQTAAAQHMSVFGEEVLQTRADHVRHCAHWAPMSLGGELGEGVPERKHVIVADVADKGGSDETAATGASEVHARKSIGRKAEAESSHDAEVVIQQPRAAAE